MKKIISLFAVGVFALAGVASAATISDAVFSNGDVTIDAMGNSTVTGTFTLQVGANEVCEVLRTQASPEPFTDTQVGGPLGYQQGTYTNVPFSVKVSPNTGTYYPTVQCAGIWGGNHSVDGADNVVATGSLGTIRVTPNPADSTGSPSTGSDTFTFNGTIMPSWMLPIMIKLGLITAAGTPAPTPAVDTKCAELATKMSVGMQGTTSIGNSALQGFLVSELTTVSNPTPIPALAHGAAYGFWGTQTQNAISQFKLQNQCQ